MNEAPGTAIQKFNLSQRERLDFIDSCFQLLACCLWLLAFGLWLVACCLLLVACGLLLVACCLLFAVCCMLYVVCCLLFAVCCLLFAVCCLLFVVCCLLFVVCCRVSYIVCCVCVCIVYCVLCIASWLFIVVRSSWVAHKFTLVLFSGNTVTWKPTEAALFSFAIASSCVIELSNFRIPSYPFIVLHTMVQIQTFRHFLLGFLPVLIIASAYSVSSLAASLRCSKVLSLSIFLFFYKQANRFLLDKRTLRESFL